MSLAIYAGTFDPVTNGHLDILDRSLEVFSEVVVLIAANVQKNPCFTVEERVQLFRQAVKDRKNVRVETWDGLTMDYARKIGAKAVIRGLRAASDFEYEFMMATMNKQINPAVETVFMMASQETYFVSSSMIRELFAYGGSVAPYVPSVVEEAFRQKRKKGN